MRESGACGKCLAGAVVLVTGALVAGEARALDPAEALDRIRAGDPEPLEKLSDHPASDWFEKAWLQPRLAEVPADEVAAFLIRNRHQPYAARLRGEWLKALGNAGRWDDFARYYRGERGSELRCLHARERLASGDEDSAYRIAAALWTSGRHQPATCGPLFNAAREAGKITPFMVRERMRMALDRGNLALARSLADEVDGEIRERFEHELKLRERPRELVAEIDPATADEAETEDFVAALERLARSDAREARDHWAHAQRQGLEPEAEVRDAFQRRVAIEAARQHLPEAHIWLAASGATDGLIQSWRVRDGLRRLDWEAVKHGIEGIPGWQQQRRWRYWHARARYELGDTGDAEPTFAALAERDDYYGLLASRQLGELPERGVEPIVIDPSVRNELSGQAGIERARSLVEAGWPEAAREEWRRALAQTDRATRCQAAGKARDWGWDSEAVITAARAGCRGDPEIDYPLVQKASIRELGEELDLDPAWAWGVMRAESLFMPEARSPAGAIGIMQLMPGTASYVAERLEMTVNGDETLLDPDKNVTLGMHYLAELAEQFDGHPVVATAAYNAGPNRVRTWLPQNGDVPAEVWAETVPFQETRQYLRRVLNHSLGFDARLENGTDSLDQRLRPVRAAPRLAQCDPESRMSRAPSLPETC